MCLFRNNGQYFSWPLLTMYYLMPLKNSLALLQYACAYNENGGSWKAWRLLAGTYMTTFSGERHEGWVVCVVLDRGTSAARD